MTFSKKVIFACSILFVFLFSNFYVLEKMETSADDIVGDWYTDGQESVISIYKNGNIYEGKISWVAEPNDAAGNLKRDVENPNAAKRNDLITDVQLLQNFKFDGVKTWTGGMIYNPEDGKEYKGEITLGNINLLKLRGYIGAPVFGRTVKWNRKR